ncbi:MAG TPA: 3-hydroxyacyl-CoA dehydrogenase [Actinomycetes bacterium]|nr:3-hydroxyacyl-CoA dehydrogenase [Actinomycetes bacterium]
MAPDAVAGIRSDTPVGVIGAGTMGAGIAQVAALAGHPVLLYDVEPDQIAAAVAGLHGQLGKLAERGKLAPTDAAAAAERIGAASDLGALRSAGLVVEAIVESLPAKRELLAELEDVVKPETILASNTSSLSIDAMAVGLRSPGRVVGMHFFNPAPVMRLVEIVHGSLTEPAAVDVVRAVAAAWGKIAVPVANSPGFIVNRVARPFYGEAQRLVEEGAADPATIDAVLREAGGFRMGPLELTDLIGQDVNLAVCTSVWEATYLDPRYAPSIWQRALVEAGRLGRKSGRGVYDYDGDTPTVPAPATAAPAPPPASVRAGLGLGPLEPLVARAVAAGVPVGTGGLPGELLFPNVRAALTAGTLAIEAPGGLPLVTLDLALDYQHATRLAVAASARCTPEALAEVAGFLQAAGLAVSVVADTPGLVVMRTVARLVNEAADLVGRGVASAADIDLAMRYGANYPIGPLELGDRIGTDRVRQVLDAIEDRYRDGRYRPCLWLRSRAGRSLHEPASGREETR